MASYVQHLAFVPALPLDVLLVRLTRARQVLASVLNASTARCWSSEAYNPYPGVMDGVPSARGFQGGFAASLMEKDLHLALQVRETRERDSNRRAVQL